MTHSIPATLFKTEHRRHRRHAYGKRDPWLDLCDLCQLPDCIRADGDYQPVPPNTHYPGCAIYDAARAGKKADETIAEWRRQNDHHNSHY